MDHGILSKVRATLRGDVTHLIFVCVPLLLLTPRPAQAYIDPGSGAFLYQALCAACLGGLYFIRRLINKFRRR